VVYEGSCGCHQSERLDIQVTFDEKLDKNHTDGPTVKKVVEKDVLADMIYQKENKQHMHPRLLKFFETKGRRLAELKAAGGQEYMIVGTTKNLTEDELKEFKVLSTQMDAMIWVLMPENNDEQQQFIQEIKDVFSAIEKPYFDARDITKGKRLPRGYA